MDQETSNQNTEQPAPSSSPIGSSAQAAQITPQTTQTTNGLAVAGFILSFLLPLIGIILSIVGLIQAKKNQQKGSGLAIAGIVISAISMLAWLLIIPIILTLSSFSNVQDRARDTERETDIKALHSQIEAYYAKTAKYPTLSDLNNTNWRFTNLKGIDDEALVDPTAFSSTIAATASAGVYGYTAKPTTCDNIKVTCSDYTLAAVLETGDVYELKSLNAPLR